MLDLQMVRSIPQATVKWSVAYSSENNVPEGDTQTQTGVKGQ